MDVLHESHFASLKHLWANSNLQLAYAQFSWLSSHLLNTMRLRVERERLGVSVNRFRTRETRPITYSSDQSTSILVLTT
jgi:hypothetical protein